MGPDKQVRILKSLDDRDPTSNWEVIGLSPVGRTPNFFSEYVRITYWTITI